MIIDRPLCPDGRIALAGTSTSPCLAGSRPFILAAAILSSAMGFIDGSVVTIALPSIERELSAPFETVQWVVNGYALTLGSVILIGGAAGDRYGRKLLFLTGILSFTGASVMCALAPSILTLVGARLLQGIGAALMIPQSRTYRGLQLSLGKQAAVLARNKLDWSGRSRFGAFFDEGNAGSSTAAATSTLPEPGICRCKSAHAFPLRRVQRRLVSPSLRPHCAAWL